MKKLRNILPLLFLSTAFILQPNVQASEASINQNLLLITDNEEETNSLDPSLLKNTNVISLNQFSSSDRHVAYAISSIALSRKDSNLASFLEFMLKSGNSRVYVYGDLTIDQYKHFFNLSSFSVQIPRYDSFSELPTTGKLDFCDCQTITKQRQIICLSENKSYPSITVSGNKMSSIEQQEFIIQNYNETYVSQHSRSTIVQSGYQHKIIAYGPRLYLNIDYLLYKNNDESDPSFDYFALKTNATAVNNNCETAGNCDLLEIKNQLDYSSDSIIDFAPKSTKRASNINASVNLGGNPSASIGISFQTDSGPEIKTTYDQANRITDWKVSRFWLFGKTFNNELRSFGTSWASTGNLASVSISSYARFVGNKINHIAGWDTRKVTYRY